MNLIYTELIGDAFCDRDWFLEHNSIRFGNGERRARHLPVGQPGWLYIDDWAREFVVEVFGEETYRYLDHRQILTCDPYGDGQDIVDFIASAAKSWL